MGEQDSWEREPQREPWMRGTHGELDPLRRAVVHALEQAGEDAERWCASLSQRAIFARPGDLAPVAFHLRHVVRSLDRLLTYAEDRQLDEQQLVALTTEMAESSAEEVMSEFRVDLERAKSRVVAVRPEEYDSPRGIGRKRLPTTVTGLLIHCAEHTQRHIGQMVTTAKLVSLPGVEGTA